MRLLFVNAHYHPDVAATAHHLTDLAEDLARRGHDVHVLAGRGKYVAGKVRAPTRETRHGVRVRRAPSTTFGRGSLAGRLVDYATFYALALAALLGPRRYDGVVVLTTPPLLSFAAWVARLVRGRRYAIWSQDLHPDAEFAAGMLRPRGVAGRFLEWANRTGYRGADVVVALGDYMRERLLAKGVAPARVRTIPVWIGREELAPLDREANDFLRELGLERKFVVAYIGNAGLVHDFDAVLDAMAALRDDPRVHFLFVGDGPQRPRIERFAAERGLDNVTFRGYLPRDYVRALYSAADAHLVSLRAPFVGIAVPTKLYQAMGSARPVAFVGPKRSESADAVRAAQAGAVIDPADGGAGARLVETIRGWCADPAGAARAGVRGRAYVLREHERDANCAAFERALADVWAGRAVERDLGERDLPAARVAPELEEPHATLSSRSQ